MLSTNDYEHIEVGKVGGNIGAEIGGVPVSGELDRRVVDEIRRALLRRRVVFLRGQHHAEADTQLAFAGLLGTPTKPHPTVTGDGRAVLPIDSEQGRANSWHTDVTFVDRIPHGFDCAVLRSPPRHPPVCQRERRHRRWTRRRPFTAGSAIRP